MPGNELAQAARKNPQPGRRTTIIKGPNAEAIEPNKRYRASDLLDKYNRPVKFGDMPDRTKGGFWSSLLNALTGEQSTAPAARPSYTTSRASAQSRPRAPTHAPSNSLFWGERSALSKRIILEQCEDIGRIRFGGDVQIDHENAHTFVVNSYLLPSKWHSTPGVVRGRTPLAIVFPTQYPKIAPIGFYLKATVRDAPNGHFYNQAYHNADKVMLEFGWKWYCVYVKEDTWMPAKYRKPNDWRYGDNIWTYFDLIKESLSSYD